MNLPISPDQLLEFIGNHYVMAGELFLVTILLIQDIFDNLFRKHTMVSPSEAVILLNNDATILVDVREATEFAEGHIEGARNIPFGKLDERVAELDGHKASAVIVTCQSGTRSLAAGKKLTGHGFTQVYELKGGLFAWKDQNLPVTKKRK